METTTARMTAAEYFEVSEEGDHLQLIDGRLVVNEARPFHQLAQARLLTALHRWTEEAQGRGLALGPIDIVASEHDVYGPDVVWIAEARVPGDLSRRFDGMPDIAVEVRSPGTWRYDVGRKKAAYEAAGLPELWLVDTAAEVVLVFRRSGPAAKAFDVELEVAGEDVLASPQLDGFGVPVRELFRRHSSTK